MKMRGPQVAGIGCVAVCAAFLALGQGQALDPGSWLTNGNFDTGVSNWQLEEPYPGTGWEWFAEDRGADSNSGSGQLSIEKETVNNVFATQCRPVLPQAKVATFSGSIRYLVDSGDSNAWIQAAFFSEGGCKGQFLGELGGSVHDPANWTDISDTDFVPQGARSVVVRLGLQKTTTAAPLSAEFDRIRLAFDYMPSHQALVPLLARD